MARRLGLYFMAVFTAALIGDIVYGWVGLYKAFVTVCFNMHMNIERCFKSRIRWFALNLRGFPFTLQTNMGGQWMADHVIGRGKRKTVQYKGTRCLGSVEFVYKKRL